MDWHFRVHQRIMESEKRGQHRSWYVDQAVSTRDTTLFLFVESSRMTDVSPRIGSNPERPLTTTKPMQMRMQLALQPPPQLPSHLAQRSSTSPSLRMGTTPTLCAQSARRNLSPSGWMRHRSGCGQTPQKWATVHTMRAAMRR